MIIALTGKALAKTTPLRKTASSFCLMMRYLGFLKVREPVPDYAAWAPKSKGGFGPVLDADPSFDKTRCGIFPDSA